MFVSEEVLVGAPVDEARQRLFAQLDLDGLHDAAVGALTDIERSTATGASAARQRILTVHTLPSYLSGQVTVIPLRWNTSSPLDDRFPVMDANLELQLVTPVTSRLSLTGSCRSATGQPVTKVEQDDALAIIKQFLGRLAGVLGTAQVDTSG